MSSFKLIQHVSDFTMVLLGFALGYWIYHWDPYHSIAYSLSEFLIFGTIAGLLFIAVFQSLRLYESKTSLLNVVETRRLFLGWSLGALTLFAVSFYLRFLDLSRLMISFALGITLLLLIVSRSALYHLHMLARMRGRSGRNVLIYGAGTVGRHLFKRIYHSPGLGLHVIGFLDDEQNLWGQEVHIGELRRGKNNIILGGLTVVSDLVKHKSIREIFVAMPNASYQRNLEIVQFCRSLDLTVSVVPPTYGHQIHNLEVEDIGGIPILREKEMRPHFLYPMVKRAFDLSISAFALFALSPLFGVLALIVRSDSPGPVIFRQRRVGLGGKEFDFYKFRTMQVAANPYAQTPASSDDPRITKFGRWLRRSSLDELPQFWNVLKGDMSIVGPRPEMPFIVANYSEEQMERIKVKPGITGVWQISAVRGEPIHANMEYDLFYIEHRSVLLDVIIVLKTIATAIRGIGAH